MVAARKATKPKPLPEGWVVETEVKINGRSVTPGTELSITGVRGRVFFVRQVTTPTACWIDVITPEPHKISRSFHLDKVKRVHRLDKTRENLT
jgi:hypothetical protein